MVEWKSQPLDFFLMYSLKIYAVLIEMIQ